MKSLGLMLLIFLIFPKVFAGKQFSIGVVDTAPYGIADKNIGIYKDVISECLKDYATKTKSEVVFRYMGINQVFEHFGAGRLDATAFSLRQKDSENVFYSEPYIETGVRAVSFKDKKFKIEKISDLKDKSVIAFETASKVLGQEFSSIAEKHKNYKEIGQFDRAIFQFYSGKSDIIIIAPNVFKYYQKIKYYPRDRELVEHQLFPELWASFASHDKLARDMCDVELKKMKSSGRIQAIVDQYIK